MPRVAIGQEQKREYKIRDLAGWIYGRMHSKGLRQENVAKILNISQQALSNRINPKTYKNNRNADPFSYGDLLTLFKLLELSDDEILKLMKL